MRSKASENNQTRQTLQTAQNPALSSTATGQKGGHNSQNNTLSRWTPTSTGQVQAHGQLCGDTPWSDVLHDVANGWILTLLTQQQGGDWPNSW